MARANRHFISGYAWHLTHRCHKREFLLKFAKDKQRWLYWLFEAKKRFGLCVLNFTVTSNHVHLLIYDTGNGNETIPKSIQLIAGKTGQEFNHRKGRNGAFWQERYHATAVTTDDHLIRCMVISDRTDRLQPEDNTIYWQNGPENYLDPNMSLEGSF
jgi:putative transposase